MNFFFLSTVVILSLILCSTLYKLGRYCKVFGLICLQWVQVQLRSAKATQVRPGSLSPRFAPSKSSSRVKSALKSAASTEKPMAVRVPTGVDYSSYDEPTWQRAGIQLSF